MFLSHFVLVTYIPYTFAFYSIIPFGSYRILIDELKELKFLNIINVVVLGFKLILYVKLSVSIVFYSFIILPFF